MTNDHLSLRPKYTPAGFRFYEEHAGTNVGELRGPRDLKGDRRQVAVRYRQPGQMWGLGSEMTIAWGPDRDLTLAGTNSRVGVSVTVHGKQAIYHDGMWMPGPGDDQIPVKPNGSAHWGRGLVHSLTIRAENGVFALRCPRSLVPGIEELIKIMSSVDMLAETRGS